jgi:hypothetical protein
MQNGACHCGAVRVSVPHLPAEVTECGCSICRRYGALWAYYRKADISLSGPTDVYVWGRRSIGFHRCSSCGCIVGWLPLDTYPECGINARVLDDFRPSAVTVVVEDDASI